MKQKLHPGVKWSWRIGSYFGTLFFAIFLGIWLGGMLSAVTGEISFFKMIIPMLIVFIVSIIWLEIWIGLAYNRWFYEFTPTNLKTERGVIWKRYSNVPYERIQNVDIQRGIIARILGFSSVNIQTAGYSGYPGRQGVGAEGYIPAVEMKRAEEIRDFIIKKISKKHGQGL